jgi:hypothetical protein
MTLEILFFKGDKLFYSAVEIFGHSGLKMLKRVVNTDHMVGLVAQETICMYDFFSTLCVTDRLLQALFWLSKDAYMYFLVCFEAQ